MLLAVTAVFVGSQACQPCHAAIVKSYQQTPMARSSGPAKSIALPAVRFSAGGHDYRIDSGRLIFQAGSKEVAIPIDFFIGSGSAGRSFVVAREPLTAEKNARSRLVGEGSGAAGEASAFSGQRFLFELPVTWYARKNLWDASPGYEHEPEIKLNRAIEPSCLFCHASRVRPIFRSQNRYADPPFLENGIGCERCHGPGGRHVRDPKNAPMVNPARLAPELRDSVCSQCHLTGVARIERAGRRMGEFQAGNPLAEFATYFVREGFVRDSASDTTNGALKVTSHVERLASSACKRASGDRLWCGTCHDPHAADQVAATRHKTQAACMSCHPEAKHNEPMGERLCADCHMPKSQVTDAGHSVMTDHAISLDRTAISRVRTGGRLVAFLGTADDRALGLAYAELGDPRTREYLLRAKPVDSEVRLRLAALEPNPARATELYESVLRDNPAQPAALVNLGSLYAQTGRLDDAAALWRRALENNPGIEEAALNLARIVRPEEAKSVLTRYLESNPGSRAAQARLHSISAR
jgi:predicted CXXCH cytochrome family protein